MQKWGGLAALLQAVMFASLLIIIPGLGVSLDLFTDAAKVQAAFQSPGYAALNTILLLFSLTVLLVAMGLRDRLQEGAPNRSRLLVMAASIASAMFLLNGMIGFGGGATLAKLAGQDLALAKGLFTPVNAVLDGLAASFIFMTGWVEALAGWAALTTKKLPQALGWLLVVAGVVSILSVLLPFAGVDLQILGAVLPVVLNLVWSLWLGVVLWRSM
jgi:hypothetical protein